MHNQPEDTTPEPAAASHEATESVDCVPGEFTGTTLEELNEWAVKRATRVPDKFTGTTLEELRIWAVARSIQSRNDLMKKRHGLTPADFDRPPAASQESTKSVDRVPDKFPGTTLEELHVWSALRSMQADNDRMKKVHSKKPSDFGL